MSGLIVAAGALLFLAGLISILVPLRFLRIRTRGQGFGIMVLGIVLIGGSGAGSETASRGTDRSTASSSATGIARSAAPARSTEDQAMANAPASQRTVVRAVETARSNYRSASNEMARGAARPNRKTAICAALLTFEVRDWIGVIADLSTNNEGSGVLSVRFGNDVHASTWNNTMSDIGTGSLISPSSPVFAKAASLSEGDWVRFSGSFVRDDVDCIGEQSMTLSGSITDPEFTFKFSDIAPLG